MNGRGAAIAVVAVGGAIGALGRWALQGAWPTPPGGFPVATFGINVGGALAIGVLMVVVTELVDAPALVRPFLGVGVLGGFTTFSAYAVEVQLLIAGGRLLTAGLYLAGTVAATLVAAAVGMAVTRRIGGVA